MLPMSTEPGWADALGRELAGDDNVWQRLRARKGRPFKVGDSATHYTRGAQRGGASKHTTKRLALALGKAEE